MPRPVFDIEQYELRGTVPPVFTGEQRDLLNQTLSRVNGQIDWTAQLLGFNGANYWGLPNPKSDGTYNWVGLPETMNEKRAVQVGAFGVYGKDQGYDLRPAPFNRSEIRASADFTFDIWEKDGVTQLTPIHQPRGLVFEAATVLFEGAAYTFNAEVEVTVPTGAQTEIFVTVDRRQKITQLRILGKPPYVEVNIEDSDAVPFTFTVTPWKDISDWKDPATLNQFIGVWGNKGNQISSDFLLDALDVHGFNEDTALRLNDVNVTLTVEELLATVGLEPTPGSYTDLTNYRFEVAGCDALYLPVPTETSGRTEIEFGDCETPNYQVELSSIFDTTTPTLTTQDGLTLITESGLDILTEETGLEGFRFTYEPFSNYARINFPCVEWVFDPTLDNGVDDTPCFSYDNGSYDEEVVQTGTCLLDNALFSDDRSQFDLVNSGTLENRSPVECVYCSDYVDEGELAWATANNGEYDFQPEYNPCWPDVNQTQLKCVTDCWNGFDDGEYDEPTEPNCDEQVEEGCPVVNGGLYNPPTNPSRSAHTADDCCQIDGGVYIVSPLGPPPFYNGTIDGGQQFVPCTIYDNGFYQEGLVNITCEIDNGVIEGDLPVGTIDENIYDRELDGCVECTEDDNPPVEPCPLDPVRVRLEKIIFSSATWTACPCLGNTLTPLRTWKARGLHLVDPENPDINPIYSNPLIADENTGPDDDASYRNFIRLPFEYARNGKFWNRASSVAANQNYFSTPPNLVETRVAPPVIRPLLYSETYFEKLDATALYYEESYLSSSIRSDTVGDSSGFEGSRISFAEGTLNQEYEVAVLTTYDPFEARIPKNSGEWSGSYYFLENEETALSGYLETDVTNGILTERSDSPVYDESALTRPNVEFPDSVDEAPMKNYVVSYAYFVTDLSAADDPVFDPNSSQCWREECLDYIEEKDGEDVTTCVPTLSNYLLH